MTKYYLYTPGDRSVGINGYDNIYDSSELVNLYVELTDEVPTNSDDEKHLVRLITEIAKQDRGFFGTYKECPRHKVHIHPKFGCDVCSDEHMGITEPIKMRRGKFDDED